MNAQTAIDFDAGPAAGVDSLPMPRATLESLERQRDRALAALMSAWDAHAEAMEAARAAAVSFTATDQWGAKRDPAALSDEAQKALFGGHDKRETYGREDVRTWREVFADETRQKIDRAVWEHVIQATDLEKLMDHQAREEFRDSMAKDPPAPTVETIRATLGHYCSEAPNILKRGIAKAFSALDRRFRSHDGFKIGSRIILDYLFDASGWRGNRAKTEQLRDIERAFMLLDGREHPESYAGIVGLIDGIGYRTPRPVVVESDWVRVRVFKNGNAHLWFKRDDLVRKVNRLLADYYGETIGEGSDVCDTSDLGPQYHLTPARNLGFFETSAETAATLLERISLPYLIREGKVRRVLEPSAGNGALADPVRDMGCEVHCVEIDEARAFTLRRKGHAVYEGDFLAMQPGDFVGGLFDLVVMNPPFDRGRDCDHVRHALQFVRPGGALLAIMSASAEIGTDQRRESFRALLSKTCKAARDGWRCRDGFEDLPEGSFAHAGTNVNTVTLAVYKSEA